MPGLAKVLAARFFPLWNRLRSLRIALYDQSLISAVNFGGNLLIARFLGISNFGLFGMILSIIVIFNTLQMSAIVSPMMTIGAKIPARREPRYYAVVWIHSLLYALVTSVLVGGIIFLIGLLAPRWPLQRYALLAAVTNLAFQMQDFTRRYYFARRRPGMAFIVDLISYGGQLLALGLVLGLQIGRGVNAALAVIAATCAAALVVAWLSPGKLARPGIMHRYVLIRHWRFARWLVATSGFRILPSYVYVGAAVTFLGPAAMGGLRAAQKLMGLTHVLYQGLLNIVPREAARRYNQRGIPALRRYLWQVFGLTGGSTLGVSIIAAIGAPFWLHLVYGAEYTRYALLLQLFAVQYLFASTTLPLVAGLNALERSRGIFIGSLTQGALVILLVVPMMRWLGITGVVFMSLLISVVYFAMLGGALWWGMRHHGGRPRTTVAA